MRDRRLLLLVLAVAAATTFYFVQDRAPVADTNDGLWQGTFDINGEGSYHFTALYMNGRAVGSSDDARVIYHGDV